MANDIKRAKPNRLININSKNFIDNRLDVNKGHTTTGHTKKVFKTVYRDPSDYRTVSMNDLKNTVKIVKRSDPRTNDEIRQQWLNDSKRRLRDVSA